MHLDHVACRPGMGRDDRHLTPGDPVQQRRLAGIERAGDRNDSDLPQSLSPRPSPKVLDFPPAKRLTIERSHRDHRRHIGLVREVDPGFGQRHGLDQPRRQSSAPIAQQPLQFAHRLATLRLGIGMDQIRQPFDRGQVELAVLKGPPGKFTCLGRPQPRQPRSAAKARRPPPGPRAVAARQRLRRSRCSVPQKKAPAPGRSAARPRPATAPVSPFAASAFFRRGMSAPTGPAVPETRTMAIAVGGRPDESAKMV